MEINTHTKYEKMRVGGKSVDGENGEITIFNPFNNSAVGTVPRASSQQVEKAFKTANDFRPLLTRYERQKILSLRNCTAAC